MKTNLMFLGCLLALIVSKVGLGQEAIVLKGTVQGLNKDVSDILIINLNTEKTTITDTKGLFILEVKLRDTVQFSAIHYITKKIVITDTLLRRKTLLVDLVEKVIKLKEVTVMPYDLTGNIDLDIKKLDVKPVVTSSVLGLPNADIQVMTQSERLLLEADRGKYGRLMTIEEKIKEQNILGFLTIGVILNGNKITNRVSGRTKTFEDMVARDENLKMENKIVNMFSKKILSESFGISRDNIEGFLSFCLAQTDFLKSEEAENTIQVWEYLKAKSYEFKK